MLIERAPWKHIYVLCVEKQRISSDATCEQHRGDIWWPSIRKRVHIYSAEQLDAHFATTLSTLLGNRTTRDSLHAARTMLSHLWLVNHAARKNISSVLIVEADIREALMHQPRRSVAQSERLAGQIASSLESEPWSVFRLGALFSDYRARAGRANSSSGSSRCAPQCQCEHWGRTTLNGNQGLRTCTVASGSAGNSSDSPLQLGTYCRGRSSEGYAVHSRAFAVFSRTLRWYLDWSPASGDGSAASANRHLAVPYIDDWLPAVHANTYVLPNIVTQKGNTAASRGVRAMESAADFQRHCATGGP